MGSTAYTDYCMDPSDDNSLQCDSPDGPIFVDTGVQLDLTNGCKTDGLVGNFDCGNQNINLKLPITVQNCIQPNLQDIVVINTNSFLNDQKLPLSASISSNPGQPLPKRICIEQDGQTYIIGIALADHLDDYSSVVELPQNVENTQILTYGNPEPISPKDGINQSWFTSKEEKVELHSKGHVWRTGMYSKDEIELLESNIAQYCKDHNIANPASVVFETAKDERKDFYRTIAKGLNRPLFSIYRRVVRMYDIQNHCGKYSPQELEKLKELRVQYGNDWQAIGATMGRSASSVKDRCRLLKEHCNQGKWQAAEEQRLADAVYDLGRALPGEMISSGLSWAVVADRVGTRSEKQCRSKWLNYLNWKVAGGPTWTPHDDITLICRIYGLNVADETDIDWKQVSENWPSVRSPQWLRGKWWSLKRHAPNPNDIPFPELCDYLYTHFVLKNKVKEEITILQGGDASPLDLHCLINPPKQTILQSVTLPPSPIVVTAPTQVLPPPVVTLTSGSPCVDMVNSTAPLLQTVEVLQPNILTANPQTFLIAAPSPHQQTMPPNQIIIQTVTADTLQHNQDLAAQINETVTVSMDSPQHVLIDGNPISSRLTSLASTQIPSAPSSPVSAVDSDTLLVESYGTQTMHDNLTLCQSDNISSIAQSSDHLIHADPMLAANNCSEMVCSDSEMEKHPQDLSHIDH